MKTRILSLLPLVVCFAISHVWGQTDLMLGIPDGIPSLGPSGILYIVKNTNDTPDANPGDGICADASGNCTLRAAVDDSNANGAPADVIIFELPYPSIIELTQGELNLNDPALKIVGPGARRLTIRRGSASRLFSVTNTQERSLTAIWRLRLEGSSASSLISGGAVRVSPGASLDLAEVWFAGNSAGNGGAVSNEGTLSITRSLFTGNSAVNDGGALHLAAGSVTVLTNSTLTLNSAATGGAVYAAGSIISANNAITHNAATAAASSIASASGSSVNALNTIIGADTSLPVTTITGTFISLGNNLVTDARAASGFTNGVNGDQVGDNNAIDPMLGALTDNGGQTDTRALLPGSPAIDHGNSCVAEGACAVTIPRLRWDQRTRHTRRALSSGAIVDIGAFESGSTIMNSSFGMIGGFFPNVGPRRIGFVFAIDATTGIRQTTVLRSSGSYRFSNLDPGEVYIFEHHVKNRPTGPLVLPLGF